MTKKSILVDGHSLLYRSFYGMRPMTSPKGVPTGALLGFMNVILKLRQDFQPDYFAVAFDLSTPTFRHEMYEEYKAGRQVMPEDLVVQQKILYELLDAMQIVRVTKPGYEADDILGTLAEMGSRDGVETSIVTGDRDSYQLVSNDITVLYTAARGGNTFETVNEKFIEEKYGIVPKELRVVKALMGDKSDNIPGIAGVGEKTALKLVKSYKTLENLYAHIDEQKGKLKERLILGEEDAYASLALGTIHTDVPLDMNLSSIETKPMLTEESEKMLEELGFKQILSKLKKGSSVSSEPAEVSLSHYQTPDSSREIDALLRKINMTKALILNAYTEEEPGDLTHSQFSRIDLALEVDSQYYYIEKPEYVRQLIAGICTLPNADQIAFSGHHLKHLQKVFYAYHGNIANYSYDSFLASYLIDPTSGQYDLSAIAARWLDERYPSEEEIFGKGAKHKKAEELDGTVLADWLIKGCEVIKKTKADMLEKIEADGMKILFEDIELALVPVLSEMELTGFTVNQQTLNELSATFGARLETLSKEIFALAQVEPFNLGSPKKLGEVLFEHMGLPPVKKTKTGYSTSAEVLKELSAYHPIIDKILEYRMLSKLDSTYGKGLISFVDPKTSRIYSTFQQTVTATGRLSSADPNLQNIPIKTQEGREIRKAFTASAPDRRLVDADYSQIELRILAALSHDPHLIEAFKKDEDIHASTAAKVFGLTQDLVDSEQRRFAKMINFGLIYGKQAFSLANDLGVSRKEAQDFIDRYFQEFPKIKDYLDWSVDEAKKTGYAQTLWGRRRYLPEIHSKNKMVMQSGERMALNMPIQGAAADIMKIAMIGVQNRIERENLDVKIVLQVHDELILDCPEAISDQVKDMLVEEMEHAVTLDVPLKVEAQIAYSWYDAK